MDGDDGGLVHDDALASNIDERVGSTEIDGEVVREEPGEYAQKHGVPLL